MATCARCGAELANGTEFCSLCGAPVTASPALPPSPGTAEGHLAPNVAGLLAYFLWLITGILFLYLEPYRDNKFVRFHAFQSIFFSAAVFLFWFAFSKLTVILGFLSLGIMGLLMALLGMVLWLIIMLYWILLMYKAYHNERYMIPLIGELAAKQVNR
jgi:uncharacterized membrane protein